MNVQQKLVVTFVTVAILVTIAVGLQYIDKENLDKEMIKYFLSAVILLGWFFFVFIADISMKISRLNNKVEKYHDQTQKDFRKRIQRAEENCGITS
jgi:amino acid permease